MLKIRIMCIALAVMSTLGCDSSSGTNDDVRSYELNSGNHVILGPLRGAEVKAYKLTDLNNPLEVATTDDFGGFVMALDGIEDSDIVLLEASGGEDLDADDNGELDEVPTSNQGTIRSISKVSDIKGGVANISILTEIVYQYTKHIIGRVHKDDLEQILNNIAQALLVETSTRSVDFYKNISSFSPIRGEERTQLVFDYESLLGEDNLISLYHDNESQETIESKLSGLFGSILSLNDERLLEGSRFVRIEVMLPNNLKALESEELTIPDGVLDGTDEKISFFYKKGETFSIKAVAMDGEKVLKWYGCDNTSEDFSECHVNSLYENRNISPVVVHDEIIISDKVKNISNAITTIDNTKYTVSIDLFDEETALIVSSIQVGDIIISSKNRYFSRKITEVVKVDDNNYFFETIDVPFQEIISQGYISFDQPIAAESTINTDARFISTRGTLKNLVSDGSGFILNFNDNNIETRGIEVSNDFFEKDFDGIKIKGSIKIEPSVEFDASWSWGDFEYIRLVPRVKITPSISAVIEKEIEIINPDEFKIGEFRATTIVFVGIIPIPMEYKVTLKLGASGKVSGSVTFGAEFTRDQEVGLQWVSGRGASIINAGAWSGKADAFQLKVEAKEIGGYIRATPSVGIIGLGLGLSNKLGVYGDMGASLGLGISASESGVSGEFVKVFYEIYAQLALQLTLTSEDLVEDTDFFKKLKSDFEKLSSPWNIKYTIHKEEWTITDSGVNVKKPGNIQVEGDNVDVTITSGDTFEQQYSYRLLNNGDEDFNWKVNTVGALNVNVVPSSGILKKGEPTEVIAYASLSNAISLVDGNIYANIIFSKNIIGPVQGPIITPAFKFEYAPTRKINLKVTPKINRITDASISLSGESVKNIKINFSHDGINIKGFRIFKANYNTEVGACSEQFSQVDSINNPSLRSWTSNLDNYLNIEGDLKMHPGDKYCFNIIAFFNNTTSDGLLEPLVIDIPNYAKLISNIKDSNSIAIPNAKVRLTLMGNDQISDGSGNYTFDNLMPGRYKISVEAEGYDKTIHFITLEEGQVLTYEGQFLLENELSGTTGILSGSIKDSLSGTALSSGTIFVRNGGSNLAGDIIKTLNIASNGGYELTLPTGSYTLAIESSDYFSRYENIIIVGDESRSKDIVLTAEMNLEVNAMKVVLSWGALPRDLDSHMIKTTDAVEDYHVYYSNKSPSVDARLDVDDTSSFGPETISIENLSEASKYTYYVHNYSGEAELKNSEAKVSIYLNGEVKELSIPNATGNYWKVFDIINNQLVLCISDCMRTNSTNITRSFLTGYINEKEIFRNLPVKN